MTRQRTWVILDHLCKACGGRILQCVSGAGPSAGGNPLFQCANCGTATSAMGPTPLCWCSFNHRAQRLTAYRCIPFSILKEQPQLLQAFLSCGCDPDSKTSEVGIMLEEDYLRLKK